MPDDLVIVDTSPLVYLHRTNHLHVLDELYDQVIVPMAVSSELEVGERLGFDVPEISSLEWAEIRQSSSPSLLADLGPGESEVIALGLELPDSLIVIDDMPARLVADSFLMRYTGTLGVLMRAKQVGLVLSVGSAIEALRSSGMWLSDDVVSEVLRLAGEL